MENGAFRLRKTQNQQEDRGRNMLNITNQNGVTYDTDITYRYSDMNGKSEDSRPYQLLNMNGISWDDTIPLSFPLMQSVPARPASHSFPPQ